MSNDHPLRLFLCWIGESTLAMMVSMHFNFDLNEFRVWSLWLLSIILGMVQLLDTKTTIGNSVSRWRKRMAKNIKELFER